MLNELHPELAVTVGAYEKLVEVVGADSTLAILNRQVKIAREEEKQSKQHPPVFRMLQRLSLIHISLRPDIHNRK